MMDKCVPGPDIKLNRLALWPEHWRSKLNIMADDYMSRLLTNMALSVTEAWEVFHYTWRVFQIRYRGNLFLRMELVPWFMTQFVLEIRWRLCIGDAKLSYNFMHKLGCISISIGTPSTNLQSHENSFGGLTKCSETLTWPVSYTKKDSNSRALSMLPNEGKY